MDWEFVYVAVDDASRLAYVEVLEDERKETADGFLRRAVGGYAERGVRRVLTDDGAPFLSRLWRATCAELGVRPRRTRPYRPRTNGDAERFIRTLLREWAYGKPYETSAGRRRALPAWLRYYHGQRARRALGMRPPMTRLPRA